MFAELTSELNLLQNSEDNLEELKELYIKKRGEGSKAELVVTDENGNETRELIHDFSKCDGTRT